MPDTKYDKRTEQTVSVEISWDDVAGKTPDQLATFLNNVAPETWRDVKIYIESGWESTKMGLEGVIQKTKKAVLAYDRKSERSKKAAAARLQKKVDAAKQIIEENPQCLTPSKP